MNDAARMSYTTAFASVRGAVSAAEWQARVELAACYRLVDLYWMSDLIYNHITTRIPGTDELLINLYGLVYREITASSLARIDREGNILICNSAVANLIREKKTFQIYSIIQTSKQQGMTTLNDSLLTLVKNKVIDFREAYTVAVNKSEFEGQMTREGMKTAVAPESS